MEATLAPELPPGAASTWGQVRRRPEKAACSLKHKPAKPRPPPPLPSSPLRQKPEASGRGRSRPNLEAQGRLAASGEENKLCSDSKLEEEGQIKPGVSRRKEIIGITAGINDMENRSRGRIGQIFGASQRSIKSINF